ncbi:MAG: hypothetical protein R3E32_19880 [Chitinophagales bacterium]
MRGAYSILAVVIIIVLLGVFAIQSGKTKAYTSNEGSHKMELTQPSEVYAKYDFKPKGQAVPVDTMSLEAVMDSIED